jgi:hypothetical protein
MVKGESGMPIKYKVSNILHEYYISPHGQSLLQRILPPVLDQSGQRHDLQEPWMYQARKTMNYSSV